MYILLVKIELARLDTIKKIKQLKREKNKLNKTCTCRSNMC